MPQEQAGEIAFIKENFGSIWPVHLAAFTKLLVQLRTRFDGDLELLLIMAVIGDRTRPENWTPEVLTYRQLTRGDADEHKQYPINIQSVADYTGIPRETVRRKLRLLTEKGWIERDGNGWLKVSRAAARDLEVSTKDTIAYLAAVLAAFNARRGRRDTGT